MFRRSGFRFTAWKMRPNRSRVLPLIPDVNPARDEQMSIDAEAIADRRRLRRKLSFWRVLGFSGLIAAVAAIGYAAADRLGYGGVQSQIARISVGGVITGNQRLADLMERAGNAEIGRAHV